MHDAVAANLEPVEQRRKHGGGTRLGIMQKHNSALIRLDAAKRERKLLPRRDRIPVVRPEIASSTRGVVTGLGPSSKVSTTSLGALRELLAADARRRAGVHRENARRAQRIRIAGAGDLHCPRERGAKRMRRGGGRALQDPWSPHPITRN